MVSLRNRALALALLLARYRQSRRRFGIHPINRGRFQHGEYHHLMPKLREHPDRFREYFRMPVEQFDLLLQLVHNRYDGTSAVKPKCNFQHGQGIEPAVAMP